MLALTHSLSAVIKRNEDRGHVRYGFIKSKLMAIGCRTPTSVWRGPAAVIILPPQFH